jgi:hypothetical protein
MKVINPEEIAEKLCEQGQQGNPFDAMFSDEWQKLCNELSNSALRQVLSVLYRDHLSWITSKNAHSRTGLEEALYNKPEQRQDIFDMLICGSVLIYGDANHDILQIDPVEIIGNPGRGQIFRGDKAQYNSLINKFGKLSKKIQTGSEDNPEWIKHIRAHRGEEFVVWLNKFIAACKWEIEHHPLPQPSRLPVTQNPVETKPKMPQVPSVTEAWEGKFRVTRYNTLISPADAWRGLEDMVGLGQVKDRISAMERRVSYNHVRCHVLGNTVVSNLTTSFSMVLREREKRPSPASILAEFLLLRAFSGKKSLFFVPPRI